MSRETIEKVLREAGLTDKEAEVYILLAKHDNLKGTEIAKLTKKDRAQIFRILTKLQAKGFVEATLEFPARYAVVSFENILESIVRAKREEVAVIEKSKKQLVDYMKKKQQTVSEPSLEKFVVIKGKEKIYSKMTQLILKTNHQLSAIAAAPNLLQADQFGVFDVAFKHPSRTQINYRFITDLSQQNLNTVKSLLKRTAKTQFNFKVRNPELGISLFPKMITRDDEEILFFTTLIDKTDQDDLCFWTNCKSLVQAFTAVFEDLWQNSTDIQDKIAEIETGQPTSKTCVFGDQEVAERKYEETIQSAEKEIILITSSKGLIGYNKNIPRLKNWKQKGVSVKIMAPIVGENLKAAEQLSKICAVKHVPTSYLESTIVDGKHFFQFKPSPQNPEYPLSTQHFQNSFYTNSEVYVEKMKNMLNDLWKNARTPSTTTLKKILERTQELDVVSSTEIKPSYFKNVSGLRFKDRKQGKTANEKDILDKIINTEKFPGEIQSKGLMRLHGSMASAVIHPPQYFNLTDMVITVFHVEKHSSFGEEDAMLIYLWREMPTGGHAYVPVAYIGDNPKAQNIWKTFMAGTLTENNIQLVRKEELQIRIHGNTLFAGWTRQIPLLPPKHNLPPACLLIEGYGDLKTDSYTIFLPSNYRTNVERNGYDAFVTFFHPESKYSGPGTDGFFARDYVATTYPPSTFKNLRVG